MKTIPEKIRQLTIRRNMALLRQFLAERGKKYMENITDWYDWPPWRRSHGGEKWTEFGR